MKLEDVKNKAKELGIDPGKMKKADIIHAVQEAEGNRSCFGKSGGSCPYSSCCFYDDCIKIK